MAARLPNINGDDGTWGTILNEFLQVGHNSDGTLKSVGGVFNIKDYGAVGDGATDDTTAINNALTASASAGGIVQGVRGANYLISAPLVIGSNTVLDMLTCTVTESSGSNCTMLIDSAHNAGTATVPSAMSNIMVFGGTWDRGTNTGTGNAAHSIILGGSNIFIEKCTFRSAAGKYAVLIQNAVNFTVRDLFMDDTFSDGVHIQGPAARGLVQNIKGTTGDDMVAITPSDYTAYTWGNEGDVTDVLIDTVQLIDQAAACGVKILGGTTNSGVTVLNTKRIKVFNVTGTTATGFDSAVYIGDDSSSSNTQNGQIDDITIDGVSVALSSSADPIIKLSGSTTSLTIPNITIRNVTVLSDMSAVVSHTHKVTSLIVENVKGTTSTTSATGVILLSTNNSWTVLTRLMLSNVDVTYATTGGNLIAAKTSGQTLTDVYLSDIYINKMAGIADVITATNFYLSNIRVVGNSRILFLTSGAAIVIQSAIGINAATTSSTVPTGTTLEIKSYNFPMDVSNAQLVKNTGNMAYNTNAALSCGVGPVGYNGTAWYNSLSAATY